MAWTHILSQNLHFQSTKPTMATHHPFLLHQSFSFPNHTNTTKSFHEFHMQQHHDHVMPISFLEYATKLNANSHSNHNNDQDSIANNLQSSDSSISMVVHDHKVESNKRKMPTIKSSPNYAQSNGATKEISKRRKRQKRSNNHQENKKKNKDIQEEGQIGYIHVRARRGQATDSHSLAERVRREKISERMKILQAIVPGCDKITGKAPMLDEIINYVQSLQNEIELLSLKLASVNPMLDEFGADYQNMSSMQQRIVDEGINTFTTNQQQLLSFQQEDQMPIMLSQNNGEVLWDLEEQSQELDNPFAINNFFNSFY